MVDEESSVRVAVRIRPQIPREVIDMCRMCTAVTPGEPQVTLGSDKAFTFDYVFDTGEQQAQVYDDCVAGLVEGALKGYNATVLAYGQTGSGKTYTMGTGFDVEVSQHLEGIIPRAVRHLFSGIEELQSGPCAPQFSVGAQFMELYNEEVIDLLDPYSKGRMFKIHEDSTGSISVAGATLKPVGGPQDAIRCLQAGALARTTASTQMNAQSSRSHALFTLLVRQQKVISSEESGTPEGDLETLTSKFHFVDLAGSERLKRTMATGERAKEGISINCGLLALGNVISALGDKSKRASHVPYRDSKLTRLLQDSLGGNSQTLMIACISPSDRDFMETLNTLKYANRARNIKNRVMLNQDQSSRTIGQLRRELASLQMELLEYKQGKRSIDAEGNGTLTDTFHENALLASELARLRQRLRALQDTVSNLTTRNTELLAERAAASWGQGGEGDGDGGDGEMTKMVRGYLKEIEELRAKLLESDSMYQQVKKASATPVRPRSYRGPGSYVGDEDSTIIEEAKRELEREREELLSRSLVGVDGESQFDVEEAPNDESLSESEDDNDSDTDKEGELGAELAELSHDIDMKQKLISQLEVSQQRLQTMKQHYEDKLAVLATKIQDTQKERDQVLANISTQGAYGAPSDKVRKVRDEYERKLMEMQRELRRLQYAQKEHAQLQRSQAQSEHQMKTIRAEVAEMKRAKVKLLNKMKEEHLRHRDEEASKIREIAQLRKESRKNANTIRSLQADKIAKEQVLKRKTEEVTALRKGQRTGLMSRRAQGRMPFREHASFSARSARQKWESLQRTLTRSVRSRQASAGLEQELERLLAERETLGRDLEKLKLRRHQRDSLELANEEDSARTHLRYLQDSIAEVQHAIIELEEGKETRETGDLQNLLGNVSTVEEARFLMDKLCGAAVSQAYNAAMSETKLKEKEAMLNEVQQDSRIQQELLQHVLAQAPLEAPASMSASTCSNGASAGSSNSSRSPSPTMQENFTELANSIISPRVTGPKVRRRTALPSELLFGPTSAPEDTDNSMTKSLHQEAPKGQILARVPSAPGSLKGLLPVRHIEQGKPSPLLSRRGIEGALSPRVSRRTFPPTISKGPPTIDLEAATPPGSPPAYRRVISREEDVFSRLTGAGGTIESQASGNIREYTGKVPLRAPLQCTHVVEGHSTPVLAIKVTEDQLFTASADRTVKVWDLQSGASPQCLGLHPGAVVGVAYDSLSGLLYSASGSYVKVWDLRTSNQRPIKTLCSSGAALGGGAGFSTQTPGETPVTALCLGGTGALYVAASDKVRIWDLRKYSCTGKLAGGHQAAVMCVAVTGKGSHGDVVVTGSKDHYIKVFNVTPTAGGLVTPSMNLEPPHYDGVQALLISERSLFSGSRDAGIKQWDLHRGELCQSLNNAHKGWVSGLAHWGGIAGSSGRSLLLSCCRGGTVRLWDSNTCDPIAEMRADPGPINDIATNSTRVFTASNDGKVRLWRLNKRQRHSSVDR